MKLSTCHKCLLVGLILVLVILIFLQRRSMSEARRRNVPYSIRGPIMITLVEIVSRAAELSNTKPFLLYGSLLGYVRNQDLICYDFDVDMAVKHSEYISLLNATREIIKEYPEYKIRLTKFWKWRQFEIVHCETEINADIFEFIKRDTYSRNVPQWYSKYFLKESRITYPIDWIDDLQSVELRGLKVYIPNKADKLLEAYYGSNYMKPDHVCDASCDKCVKV